MNLNDLLNADIPVIAKAIHKSKRCVIISGAGISVSAGIPDFRSDDGLYNLVKKQFPDVVVKGKDLFDASLFRQKRSTEMFLTFIAQLKGSLYKSPVGSIDLEMTDKATFTPTHEFIKDLDSRKKLLRCYTQNIDSLESKLNMNTDINDKKNVKVVQLHGDLQNVVCSLCKNISTMTHIMFDQFKCGNAPPCHHCTLNNENRQAAGKRPSAIGLLRPNIVLYNEEHAYGDLIAEILSTDIKQKPDLLIVMGTSLKVIGVKRMIKDIAHKVHSLKAGRVIFINKTKIGMQEWTDVFDFAVFDESDKVLKSIGREVKLLETQDKRRQQARAVTPGKTQSTLDQYLVQKVESVTPVALKVPKIVQSKIKIPQTKIRISHKQNKSSSDSSLSDQTNRKTDTISTSPLKKACTTVIDLTSSASPAKLTKNIKSR